MFEDDPRWKRLIEKYPERAGAAYELYLKDPNKGKTNPTTYFNFAIKRFYQAEKRYRRGLVKYAEKTKTTMEIKNEENSQLFF